MTRWDPETYDRFKAERSRPARDLLAQMPADLPAREIWDLGCGTGEHTANLARRWPGASVHGLDSSPEMLAVARAARPEIDWVLGDIAAFHPAEAPDVIFSNAALHWVSALDRLVPRLVDALARGGVLAIQVPLSHDTEWHLALREVAAEPLWAPRFGGLDLVRPIPPAADWRAWLAPTCMVDIWTTTYLHQLTGDDPIGDWMSGTGMRPYLDALVDDGERLTFRAAYARRIAQSFARSADGITLLPFPRLFVVARRSA